MGRIACVVAKVLGVEYRTDGVSRALINGSEDRANSRNHAVVVFDSLNSSLSGISRSDRCGKDKHVLTCDHGNDIVAEEKLASRGMLGSYHVYGLMRVKISKVTLGQLLGNKRADDLRSVEAEDSVDDSITAIIGYQLLCESLRLGKTSLLSGHVDIVVDMAMAGGKVSL